MESQESTLEQIVPDALGDGGVDGDGAFFILKKDILIFGPLKKRPISEVRFSSLTIVTAVTSRT